MIAPHSHVPSIDKININVLCFARVGLQGYIWLKRDNISLNKGEALFIKNTNDKVAIRGITLRFIEKQHNNFKIKLRSHAKIAPYQDFIHLKPSKNTTQVIGSSQVHLKNPDDSDAHPLVCYFRLPSS